MLFSDMYKFSLSYKIFMLITFLNSDQRVLFRLTSGMILESFYYVA